MTRVLHIFTVICAFLFAPIAHAQNEPTVAFVAPGHDKSGFWFEVAQTMKAAASQMGFSLHTVYANRNWVMMLKQARKIIMANPKPDYLILVNEHNQALPLLQMASDKGIPTLLLLNDITRKDKETHGNARQGIPNWIGSISPDNEVAGYEMAAALIDEVRNNKPSDIIRILGLAGDFATPASKSRNAGLHQAISESDDVQLVKLLTVNWSSEESYRRTKFFLKGQQPDAIWAANDAIALGALRALREANLKPGKDVFVAGLNWSKEAIDLVNSKEMVLTHGGHFLAGAWSMVMLYDYHNKRDFAGGTPYVHFRMSAITYENVDKYQSVLGKKDWSRIDFASFSNINRPDLAAYNFTINGLLEAVTKTHSAQTQQSAREQGLGPN